MYAKDGNLSGAQYICKIFVKRWSNVFDVGPALYKCYTNVLCLLGSPSNLHTYSHRQHNPPKENRIFLFSLVHLRLYIAGAACGAFRHTAWRAPPGAPPDCYHCDCARSCAFYLTLPTSRDVFFHRLNLKTVNRPLRYRRVPLYKVAETPLHIFRNMFGHSVVFNFSKMTIVHVMYSKSIL